MSSYPTLNFDLGDTADLLRDTVKSFARVEIAPRATIIDRENHFQWIYGARWEIWGFMALPFPKSMAAPE